MFFRLRTALENTIPDLVRKCKRDILPLENVSKAKAQFFLHRSLQDTHSSKGRIPFLIRREVSPQTLFCGDTSIDMYRRMFAFYNKFLFLNPPKSGQVHAKMWGRKRCEILPAGKISRDAMHLQKRSNSTFATPTHLCLCFIPDHLVCSY